MVGNNQELWGKLILMFHNSTMEGHSSMMVTAKTVGGLFYWRGQ